jgi:hypothetical protein
LSSTKSALNLKDRRKDKRPSGKFTETLYLGDWA